MTILAGPSLPPVGTHPDPRGGGFPFLDPARGPAEVHVVSGSFGAGHDAAAREITIRLTRAGPPGAAVWDVVDLFPARVGRMLRSAYLKQLDVSPASWGLLLRHLEPGGRLHRAVTRALGVTSRRMLAATAGADLVVSTHPFASQALGRLRSSGRLATPVVTYLTDLSVHSLWVHRGVDLHLALHEVAARPGPGWGGRATVIEPLVPYAVPAGVADRTDYRVAWGLAPDARDRAGRRWLPGHRRPGGRRPPTWRPPAWPCRSSCAAATRPCGPGSRASTAWWRSGWRSDLPGLIRAADCVIQNAGGFTSLEALAAGVPVITYRCIPGHGLTNAAALEEAGLVPWARTVPALTILLARATAGAWSRRLPSAPAQTLVAALTGVPSLRPGMSTVTATLRAGTLAAGLAALGVAAPAVASLGPARRRLAPGLAGVSDTRHVALTYDDGPDPATTPLFLDLLERHGRTATFFLLGEHVVRHPGLVAEMAARGHELAVHGWDHTCVLLKRPGRLAGEIQETVEVIERVSGRRAGWYRPPYGVLSTPALVAARAAGLRTVLWSAWGRDWEARATPRRIVETLDRTLAPGGTVLLHDTDRTSAVGSWKGTLRASETLLARWEADGQAVGPLAEHRLRGRA